MANDKKPTYQIHLKGQGLSGRGVRVECLSADQVDAIELEVADEQKEGQDYTKADFLKSRMRERQIGARRMLVEVTERNQKKLDENTKWKPVSQMQLETPGHEFSWGKLFTPKDVALLRKLYTNLHEVSQDEIDMIVGKPSPVASEGEAPATGEPSVSNG